MTMRRGLRRGERERKEGKKGSADLEHVGLVDQGGRVGEHGRHRPRRGRRQRLLDLRHQRVVAAGARGAAAVAVGVFVGPHVVLFLLLLLFLVPLAVGGLGVVRVGGAVAVAPAALHHRRAHVRVDVPPPEVQSAFQGVQLQPVVEQRHALGMR